MHGVFVIDKPSGWTSHDVVGKMRRIAGTRRVGHLGTLDPMATGVLPLVVGGATRLSQFYVRSEKLYEGVVRFGQATDTYDADGTPLGPKIAYEVTPEGLEILLARFRGTQLQTPPPVSAKKIAGTRAYQLARKNIPVELKPVEVTIHSLQLMGCEGNEARLRVQCSAGTYLRSIAHDLGQAIGCGAHLSSLRRLASGDFTIEQAHSLEELAQLASESRLREALMPASTLLPEFPCETLDPITAGQVRQGRDFRVSPFRARKDAQFVKALTEDGALLAIGEIRLPNLYHPILVLD